MTSLEIFRHRFQEILPWLLGALVVLSSDGASGVFTTLMDAIRESGRGYDLSPAGALRLAVFGVFVWLFYRQRSALFLPRTRFMKGESPEKREHLVIFLSELNKRVPLTNGVPNGLSLTWNLEQDLEKMVEYKKTNPYWNWEMPLRGLRHHVGKIRTVTIFCSKESIDDVGSFQRILLGYNEFKDIKSRVYVKRDGKPFLADGEYVRDKDNKDEDWVFEDFDDLGRGLLKLITIFYSEGIPEKEIMIDFTGGQKVTSAVAAAVTFNRKIKAQYVQTSGRHEVRGFDIYMGSADTGGLGI